MKEAPFNFRNSDRVPSNGLEDLGPQSHEQCVSEAAPARSTEVEGFLKRMKRLELGFLARPAGTGISVSSKDYLMDGRYKHPRSSMTNPGERKEISS